MGKGYIRIETKPGGQLYATHFVSKRAGGKVVNSTQYLGIPVDIEKGLFKSRKRGIFHFDLETGFTEISQPEENPAKYKKDKLVSLDFGDVWLYNEVIKKTGYISVMDKVIPNGRDTLIAYVAFKLLDKGSANVYANEWYDSSFAQALYPGANLSSQRISDFLERLGDETIFGNFFDLHLRYLASEHFENLKCSSQILIDSTGLPNDIKISLTAVNNHNGVISNETRLILVLDKVTGLPVYFRYVAGNIVDVSTLKSTLAELQAYGFKVEQTIVDAGYFSESNIHELYKHNIPFVIRLISGRNLYKQLVSDNIQDLEMSKNIIVYGDRLLYGKKVETDLFGHKCYAYIILDFDRKVAEGKKYIINACEDKVNPEEIDKKMKGKGVFILLSAEPVETREILPLYYTRQSIEQVFDLSKNNADLLPLRVHSIERYRGHLLASFIGTTILVMIANMSKNSKFNSINVFHTMRRLFVNIINDKDYIIQEPNKQMNDIIKYFKLKLPDNIEELIKR